MPNRVGYFVYVSMESLIRVSHKTIYTYVRTHNMNGTCFNEHTRYNYRESTCAIHIRRLGELKPIQKI